MRKYAVLHQPVDGICKVMVYQDGKDSAFLFLYDTTADGPCRFDQWYCSAQDAIEEAGESYGITAGDWVAIPDPQPGCQHDWIAPVRRKTPTGQEEGTQAAYLERWDGQAWADM